MPKVTPGKKYCKGYREEDLKKAIQAVSNGMPKKTAAVKHNVPRATLQFRLSNKFIKCRPGPSTVLTEEEETMLVNWLITSSRKGFPRRREDLIKSVKDFLDKNPRGNQFINNTPGEGWYKLFMKRHPEIAERTSEAVTSASSKVSERQLKNWFKQIEDYLKENDLLHILDDPSRVFNGDETNFMLCPKNTKVLAPKGDRNVYEIDHAQAKCCVTVMFTFSADGKVTPPMIIFPLKKMRVEVQRSVPSEWGIGLSDNGWMQAATFFQYVKNVLHPSLVQNKTDFPVILFVDGHKSHTTLELSQLCQRLGIILIALYPNATRILQPADVAAFRPIKSLWRKAVLEWRINNMSKTMLKTDVGPILKVLLPKIKPNILINGFRATGLCPFNPKAVDYSKCLSGHQNTTSATSTNVLNQTNFNNLVGSDLLNKMRRQQVGQSEEAKVLYEIFNYFSTTQHENIEEPNENLGFESIDGLEESAPAEIEESEMTKERKEPENATQSENYDVINKDINVNEEKKTTQKNQNCEKNYEKEDYSIYRDLQIFNENETEPNNFKGIGETDKTSIVVPEKTKDNCVNYGEGVDYNVEFIIEKSNIPEPAHNIEIITDIDMELAPQQINTSLSKPIDYRHSIPSTSCQDVIFIDGKWEAIDKIPITISKESPFKKSLTDFLVLPKTPIKKGKIQERRTFVLTSKEWEHEEIKKQNKKLEEIQLKEENKKKRLEKAKENLLKKERKQEQKYIKKELQKTKNVKEDKNKPKILQNIIIKPANKPKPTIQMIPLTDEIKTNNQDPIEQNNLKGKETHKKETEENKQQKKSEKENKLCRPLTEQELLNILNDD